jgi:hypothetical protein
MHSSTNLALVIKAKGHFLTSISNHFFIFLYFFFRFSWAQPQFFQIAAQNTIIHHSFKFYVFFLPCFTGLIPVFLNSSSPHHHPSTHSLSGFPQLFALMDLVIEEALLNSPFGPSLHNISW